MPDQPTTHAPHVDDSMAAAAKGLTRGAPIESRAEEFRMAEPPDDDFELEAIIDFAAEPLPGSLSEAERRKRSELAAALRPHAFPAERDALLRVAERERASAWILDALAQLPINTRFDTPQDVWLAMGGHRETRDVELVSKDPVERPAPESLPPAADGAAAPTASPTSTDVWRELVGLGWCVARLPFLVVKRAAHVLLDNTPRART
jgi:hypothetical protein